MDNSEFDAFADTMARTLEVYGHNLSAGAIETWWRMVSRYSLEQVQQALHAHLAESVYPPKPADVIGRLKSLDGHPGADEAWAIALQAMDENTTVAWTDQIAKAKTPADPIYAEGDRVGARMAFKAAYERELEAARQSGHPAKWWISGGHDPQERAQRIEQFAAEGRLGHEQARHHLPAPETETPALADAMRGAVEKIGTDDGEKQ